MYRMRIKKIILNIRDKITRRSFHVLIILLISFLIIYTSNNMAAPIYGDERIYIEAGMKYINGIPPLYYNYEHPPLAKYLIGLSTIIGDPHLISIICYILSLLCFYSIILEVNGNSVIALLATLLPMTDTIFINVHRHALLDPIALCLMLWAIYFTLKYIGVQQLKYGVMASIMWGLSLASKMNTLYVFTPWFIFITYLSLRKNNIKSCILFILLIILTYLLTYMQDIIYGGVYASVYHHIKMIKYMMLRHEPTLPLIINGLATLQFKLSIWNYCSPITIVLSKGTIKDIIGLENAKIIGKYIVLRLGAGSPIWYILIPLLVYKTTRIISSRNSQDMRNYMLTLCAWGALMSLIHGDVDWYYIMPVTLLYIILALNMKIRYLLLCILTALVNYILLIFGIIPFRISILIK